MSNKRTMNHCIIEAGMHSRNIADRETKISISVLAEGLELAYKEIEELKKQLNQLQQIKAD